MTLLINNNRFQNRVKRIVRNLLETLPDFRSAPDNFGINGISQVLNQSNSVFLRFAWGFVLLGCIIACLFQVQNRLSHYLAYPVVIDVKIEEEQYVKFPSITISSTDTEGALRLLQEYNVSLSKSMCGNPMKIMLRDVKGFDTNYLWSASNVTPSITLAAVITRNDQYKVKWNEEFGVHGMQVRFEQEKVLPYEGMESRFTVNITQKSSCKRGAIFISVQPNGMPSDWKNSFFFKKLSNQDLIIGIKKFAFLNRPSQICIDEPSYLQCNRRCEVEHFSNLPCRFPFITEEVKKPTCISGPGMVELYGQTLVAFRTLYCQCPRRCQETAFHISKRYLQEHDHNSVVNMYMVSNYVVIITERFAYDIITFLGDIGGTLGLCLGLSLLSIFEISQKIASFAIKSARNKRKNVEQFREVPFLDLVKRILSEELDGYRRQRGKNNILSSSKTSRIWQLVVSSVIISCVVGSCLFTYVRISRYWYEPTHMAVEIIHKETVHFPNITICGLSKQIVERLKDLTEKRERVRHTFSKPEVNIFCALKLTDLLDDPTMSADKVWEESAVLSELNSSMDFGKMLYNKSIVENVAMRDVNLPEGRCVEINIGHRPFAGSATHFVRVIQTQAFLYFENELTECDRNYLEVFVTPPEEHFRFNTRLLFPIGMMTSVVFDPKQVTLWNTKRKPCVEQTVAKECYIRCFQENLDKSLSCRLPYMPSTMKNLPLCNSSRAGKQAEATYVMHELNFDALQNEGCSCRKSCTSTIITNSISIESHVFGKRTIVSLLFNSNIYEHIVEIPSDSLSSLLCDIGGNLGITLGASLLSIFDIMQSMLVKFLRIFKERLTLRHAPKE